MRRDRQGAGLSFSFAGNRLHIAILTDFADGQKKKIRDLRESKLLRDGHVLTTDMYAAQGEADIEDMIGREAYLELVQQAYNLDAKHKLPAKRPKAANERIVKEVEEHFRTLPASVSEFDHYRPAEFLMQQGTGHTLPGIEISLDRFEQLFRDLNGML